MAELTRRLYERIKHFSASEEFELTREGLHKYILNAIKQLYIMTGRIDIAPNPSDGFYETMLNLDEQEWVLLTAQYEIIKCIKDEVSDIASYSIDAGCNIYHTREEAMNLILGPYIHKMELIEKQRQIVWVRMMCVKGV